MTRYTPQWLQAGSYAASQDRRLIGALWPAPASSGCLVQPSSGMQVAVSSGQVAAPASNATGSVLCTSDANEFVTIGAAPPSGQDRVDLIVCQPRGQDLDGGSNNDFVFVDVQGTPATSGSAVAPAVPAGAVALARILIPGGSASIAAGNITDLRPFGLSMAGAGALPPPVTTGSTIQSFTAADGEIWVAKNGVNGGAWRKARDVLISRWYRNAALGLTVAGATVVLDAVHRDTYGLYSAAGFAAPVAGWYTCMFQCGAAATGSGQWVNVRINVGANLYAAGNAQASLATNVAARAVDTLYMNAGDVAAPWAGTSVALAASVGAPGFWTVADFRYCGTG